MAKVLGTLGKCQVKGSVYYSLLFKRRKVVFLLPEQDNAVVGVGAATDEKIFSRKYKNPLRVDAYKLTPGRNIFQSRIRSIAVRWNQEKQLVDGKWRVNGMVWQEFVKIKWPVDPNRPPRLPPVQCEEALYNFDPDTSITIYNRKTGQWVPLLPPIPEGIKPFT